MYLLYVFALVCLIGLVWLLMKLYCVSQSRKNIDQFVATKEKASKIACKFQPRFRNLSESTVKTLEIGI